MPFELDTPTLIIIFAAISVVLFAEAVYLLGFSTASYRSNVNRRLKLSKNQPDREAILIQLRRERGLTGDGPVPLRHAVVQPAAARIRHDARRR